MEGIFNYFSSVYPMSNGLQEALKSVLKSGEISKKQFLFKKGHICDKIYFIQKGLFRCFYEVNEKEICSWLMKEMDIIISVESFFMQVPSYENIQAIEDSAYYYITYNELNYLYQNFMEFNFIARKLTEHYYTLSEKRLFTMRSQKAVDRYQFLRDHFPDIIQRVPSGYIASYLGVTTETLSRIKKHP